MKDDQSAVMDIVAIVAEVVLNKIIVKNTKNHSLINAGEQQEKGINRINSLSG